MPRLHARSAVRVCCIALGLTAVLLRAFQLSHRTFYWDDFLIPNRYREASVGGLFVPHDGHVMPGSIALQLLADKIAHLNFALPATLIVAGTAVALVLLYRVLRAWFPGHSSIVVVAFASLSFSPFLMDASGWWSSALNSGSWWFAFIAGLGVLSARPAHSGTPARPGTVTRSAALTFILLFGLVMTEISVSLLPAWLLLARLHDGHVWDTARSWRLWCAPGVLWLGWCILIARVAAPDDSVSPAAMWPYVPKTISHTVLPATIGGPWQWSRWAPSQAFASPSTVAWVAACVVVFAVAVWWVAGNLRRAWFLAVVIAGLALAFLLFGRTRSAEGTVEMALASPHYYVVWWAVAAFVLAVGTARCPSSRRHPRALVPTATAALVVSSVASTLTWVHAWAEDPTRDYVANLRQSLRDHPEAMVEQDAPWEILTPLAHPDDKLSAISGRRPVSWTRQPLVVDPSGHIVEAGVLAAARTGLGPVAECGYRIRSGESVMVPVTPALPFGRWVWELNAVASDNDTTVRITTPNGFETDAQVEGRAVTIPAPTEPETRWVRLEGGGGFLRVDVRSPQPEATVCLGSGAIGPLAPASR